MGDNRIFNVNGTGDEMLGKTLQLAFLQESANCTCKGWQQTKEHGLILCWTPNDAQINALPCALTAEQCIPFVTNWLDTDFAKEVELGPWCSDIDQDGENIKGWQVYVEDWGHVGDQHYSVCAIRPALIWCGK